MPQFSFKRQHEPGHWSQVFCSSGRTDCHLRSQHFVVVSVSTCFSLEFYQPWNMTLLRKEIWPHYNACLAFWRHITKLVRTPCQDLSPHMPPHRKKKTSHGAIEKQTVMNSCKKGSSICVMICLVTKHNYFILRYSQKPIHMLMGCLLILSLRKVPG